MGIASRHGKLRVAVDDDGSRWTRLEDLLTADVIGCLRYLPLQRGLGAFLGSAVSADGQCLRDWAATRDVAWAALTRATIAFWPRLAGKEPDLVVVFHDQTGAPAIAILVEAKLHDDQHAIEGLSQLGFYGRALLEDELEGDTFEQELPARRPLVFLTAGRVAPAEALRVARTEIGDTTGRTDVFWTSWWHAAELVASELSVGVRGHEHAVLEDLAADLAERGFAPRRPRLLFPLPALGPLGPFPSSRLVRTRGPGRALRDVAALDLPAIEVALRQWRVR